MSNCTRFFTQEQIEEIRRRLVIDGTKDSLFEEANYPLRGNEKIAIVQDGRNKLSTVDEFKVGIEIDEEPTENSTNIVRSGGIYNFLFDNINNQKGVLKVIPITLEELDRLRPEQKIGNTYIIVEPDTEIQNIIDEEEITETVLSDYNMYKNCAVSTFKASKNILQYSDEGELDDSKILTINDMLIISDDDLKNDKYLYKDRQIVIVNSYDTEEDNKAILRGLVDTYARTDYVNKKVIGNNYVTYNSLKLGYELMLILKSMGSKLDTAIFPESILKYDFNEDYTINSDDAKVLYAILKLEGIEIKNTTYWYTTHVKGDKLCLYKSDTEPTSDANNIWYEPETPQGANWVLVKNKEPDLNRDGITTSSDVSYFYNFLLDNNKDNPEDNLNYYLEGYDGQEFLGTYVLFAIYDDESKKIKIGRNYAEYIKAETEEDKENYIIFEFDPSPNVIYCNSFNNKLHRWNSHSEKMVPVNLDYIKEDEKNTKYRVPGYYSVNWLYEEEEENSEDAQGGYNITDSSSLLTAADRYKDLWNVIKNNNDSSNPNILIMLYSNNVIYANADNLESESLSTSITIRTFDGKDVHSWQIKKRTIGEGSELQIYLYVLPTGAEVIDPEDEPQPEPDPEPVEP